MARFQFSYDVSLETDEEAFKLFELNPALAKELKLEADDVDADGRRGSVLLKGSTSLRPQKRQRVCAKDGVVMCTESSTFKVRCAETSNLVMLIPSVIDAASPDTDAKDVSIVAVGTSKSTFMLLDAVPPLDRLEAVFDEYTFVPGAAAAGDEDYVGGASLTVLESLVQASRSEILAGLKQLGVAEVPFTKDGVRRWCKIDNPYKLKCFDGILSVVETNSWDPASSIPVETVVSALSDQFEPWVIEHVLRLYSTEGPNSVLTTIGLDERRTQTFRAIQLLERLGQTEKVLVSTIADEWARSLPSRLLPKVDGDDYSHVFTDLVRTEALALVNKEATGDICQRFFAQDLPLSAEERFEKLFEMQQKWEKEDLVSYLKAVPGDLASMLLKFTRSTNVGTGGKIIYTRR